MQRIPGLDVFGTPKGRGYLPPRVLGQAAAAPKLETSLRFEIRDVDENYIPGIGVSLISENGTHLLTGAMSDAGGNVGISAADLEKAVAETLRKNPGIQKQKIYALLQGPGYEPVKVLVFDPAINQSQMARMHEVTMQKASEGMSLGTPGVIGLGVIAGVVLGTVYWLTSE